MENLTDLEHIEGKKISEGKKATNLLKRLCKWMEEVQREDSESKPTASNQRQDVVESYDCVLNRYDT